MSLKSNRNLTDLHKNGLNYTINSCRPIALIVGLWPISFKESPSLKVIKFFLNFVSFSLMIFICISNILFGIFELNDLVEKAVIAGPTSFYIMCITKYILILFNSKKIEKCFKFVEEDWHRCENENHLEVMLKNAQFGRCITVICAIFIYLGGFGYNIVKPLMSDSIITHMNISVKPFPSAIHGKLFTSGRSPIYEIIFSSQVLAGFILYSVTIVSFSFAAVLTMHACGQFDVVILYLNKLLNGFEDGSNSGHEQFIIIVNAHLRVLSFVAKLEALFTEICFIEVLGCTLNMCLLGYYIIMGIKQQHIGDVITFISLFISFLFNIFVYCYIGEYLTHQARKVGEKGYLIDWYKLPKRTSKDLLFFIRCAQTPPKITAGKVIILSMSTFSTVVKSAGAYCNALWKMTK